MNDVIGIFYEKPTGEICFTYGCCEYGKIIKYRQEGIAGNLEVDDAIFQTWKPRRDLDKYPSCKDTRLPYEFDLLFDIKWKSELKNHLDDPDVMELCKEYGLTDIN